MSSQSASAVASTQKQPLRIALIGNPNSGKTTLFNALTGSRYKVANYPGVTVEKKEATLPVSNIGEVTFVDLPGIYSLLGMAIDEVIASKAILGGFANESKPDAILAVVDSTNIERNLYLVSQLLDCEVPVLVVLNMRDVAEERGIRIYKELLGRALGTPVVSISAKKKEGLDSLLHELSQLVLRMKTQAERQVPWLEGENAFYDLATELGRQYLSESNSTYSREPFILGCGLLSENISNTSEGVRSMLAEITPQLAEKKIDSLTFEATRRYQWIHRIVQQTTVVSPEKNKGKLEAFDAILTHRIWGSLILLAVMATIFQSIFLWAEIPMNGIEQIFLAIENFIKATLPPGQLRSLLCDGIVAGVGAVVIFVPQIAILFFFLGLLEDSGYLSRAAFVMDKLMRPFGLQGRSFIPLLSSFACAIPGILSTRTIPSFADRLTTIFVAPFMSCSARLPVYAVLIGAFIPQTRLWGIISLQGLVLLGMYLLGIFGAAAVAWALKATLLRREPALFVLELPQFHRPSLRLVFRDVIDRVGAFLKNAGTMILACSIVLWFLATYPHVSDDPRENIQFSYAAHLGKAIEPAIQPLGFNWEVGVGIIASFAAREVFVSVLSTVYHLQEEDDTSQSLIATLQHRKDTGDFSTASAISLMVFYVYACQCMSTLAVCRRETGSLRWTVAMFLVMTTMAYIASLITFQLLR